MILKDWLDKNYTVEEQSNLTYLDCSVKVITSLEGIEQLDKLNYLDCSNNNLNSLEGIEGLVKLEELNCHSNNLTSLKEIEKLDKLKWLYCSNNPLPYSNLYKLYKIKLEVIKEVRQYKIHKLLI